MPPTSKFPHRSVTLKRKHREDMSEDCAVCLEEISEWETATIDSSSVCHGCLRELFTRAVQNEEEYPPKWGNKTLNISEYVGMLPLHLIRQYREKGKEYQTPPAARVYCSAADPDLMIDVGEKATACGKFVGRIAKDWSEQYKAFKSCLTACSSCNTVYCLLCGEQSDFEHRCTNPGRPEKSTDAFAGLVKGKDYQICPSPYCHRKIELLDGCNSMRCACGMLFCFVCGEGNIQSTHFARIRDEGGCPRFGHPSAPNAIWVGGPEIDINDLLHGDRHAVQRARRAINAHIGDPPLGDAIGDMFVRARDEIEEMLAQQNEELDRRDEERRQRVGEVDRMFEGARNRIVARAAEGRQLHDRIARAARERERHDESRLTGRYERRNQGGENGQHGFPVEPPDLFRATLSNRDDLLGPRLRSLDGFRPEPFSLPDSQNNGFDADIFTDRAMPNNTSNVQFHGLDRRAFRRIVRDPPPGPNGGFRRVIERPPPPAPPPVPSFFGGPSTTQNLPQGRNGRLWPPTFATPQPNNPFAPVRPSHPGEWTLALWREFGRNNGPQQ